MAVFPLRYKIFITVCVTIFTFLLPLGAILLLRKRGYVSDMELRNKDQRLIPYILTIICFILCLLFLYKYAFPAWGLYIFYGATAAMAINCMITTFWKISAHMTGIGAVGGGIFMISSLFGLNPTALFIILILSMGALGSSRIYLKHHTLGQVVGGFLSGFCCVFISTKLLSLIF